MESEDKIANNPWAKFLGVSKLSDMKYVATIDDSEEYGTKLDPDDIKYFGYYPMQQELHLMSCRICNFILKPQALKHHMEKRHKPVDPVVPLVCDVPLPVLAPQPRVVVEQAVCSSTSVTRKLSPQNYNRVMQGKAPPPTFPVPWAQPTTVVRTKPRTPKQPKVLTVVAPVATELVLPEQSCSVSTSVPNRSSVPVTEPKVEYNCVTSSTTSVGSSDSGGDGTGGRKLEKLVIRRVLQTNPYSSEVGTTSLQKGMKSVSRNKKSSQETYFMVVNKKDQRQQNLLAARHQIKKQSDVVHLQKDKVEQKMKKLEVVRDKLISQLFSELQAVKQKLSQCNLSKSELHKELLAVREQLEETRKSSHEQTESLRKQNSEYQYEIHELKEKIDHLTASTSTFIQQNHACNRLQYCEAEKFELQSQLDELETELREYKESSSAEKRELEYKLRRCATVMTQLKKRIAFEVSQNEQLRIQKNMLEQYLPPEIRFQAKGNHPESTSFSNMQNVEYISFPHQIIPNEVPQMFDPKQTFTSEQVP